MADARIAVRLQPRSSREELVGMREGVLLVRVSAPPLDGKANRALCRLLARALGVAPSTVTVIRGQRSREKLVRVEGMEPPALRRALALALGGPDRA
jgi:uncharacterized protein